MRSGGDQWGFLRKDRKRLDPSSGGDCTPISVVETRRVLFLYRVLKIFKTTAKRWGLILREIVPIGTI